jgi:hypothetical protein
VIYLSPEPGSIWMTHPPTNADGSQELTVRQAHRLLATHSAQSLRMCCANTPIRRIKQVAGDFYLIVYRDQTNQHIYHSDHKRPISITPPPVRYPTRRRR